MDFYIGEQYVGKVKSATVFGTENNKQVIKEEDWVLFRVRPEWASKVIIGDKVYEIHKDGFITINQVTYEERKREFSHEEHLEFVKMLEDDGDTDIPSEDEWRQDLIREFANE